MGVDSGFAESKALPVHGGDPSLFKSARITLDLSTAINPVAYPFSPINPIVFKDLPYLTQKFKAAVTEYYGCGDFFPCAGTQAAIACLPQCLAAKPVLLPMVGYQRHAFAWQQANVERNFYNSLNLVDATSQILQALKNNSSQHLLVINPNNPTGICFAPRALRAFAKRLGEGAYLIVDEAFADVSPNQSLLNQPLPSNVIVLRSFGKFFGLAGIRLGFVFSSLTPTFEAQLGPWPVNGPAQAIATEALVDHVWQTMMLKKLLRYLRQLKAWLLPFFSNKTVTALSETAFSETAFSETALFASYLMPIALARQLFEGFASYDIGIRYIPVSAESAILRFGLINIEDETQVRRFQYALKQLKMRIGDN